MTHARYSPRRELVSTDGGVFQPSQQPTRMINRRTILGISPYHGKRYMLIGATTSRSPTVLCALEFDVQQYSVLSRCQQSFAFVTRITRITRTHRHPHTPLYCTRLAVSHSRRQPRSASANWPAQPSCSRSRPQCLPWWCRCCFVASRTGGKVLEGASTPVPGVGRCQGRDFVRHEQGWDFVRHEGEGVSAFTVESHKSRTCAPGLWTHAR